MTRDRLVDVLGNGTQALVWLSESLDMARSEADLLALAHRAHVVSTRLALELGKLLGRDDTFRVPPVPLDRALAEASRAITRQEV